MWIFPSLKCSKRTQNLVIFMSTFTTTFSVLWNKQIHFKLFACLFVCRTQQHFIKSTPCLFLLERNQRIELGPGGESHKNRISEKVKLFKRHNWHFRIVWSNKHHLASLVAKIFPKVKHVYLFIKILNYFLKSVSAFLYHFLHQPLVGFWAVLAQGLANLDLVA